MSPRHSRGLPNGFKRRATLPPAAPALIFPLIYPGVFCMNNSRAGRIRFGKAAEIHAAKGNS